MHSTTVKSARGDGSQWAVRTEPCRALGAGWPSLWSSGCSMAVAILAVAILASRFWELGRIQSTAADARAIRRNPQGFTAACALNPPWPTPAGVEEHQWAHGGAAPQEPLKVQRHLGHKDGVEPSGGCTEVRLLATQCLERHPNTRSQLSSVVPAQLCLSLSHTPGSTGGSRLCAPNVWLCA